MEPPKAERIAVTGGRPRRLSLRARLTALYGSLFLLSGAVLLGINYGLVRVNLPPVTDSAGLTDPGVRPGGVPLTPSGSGGFDITSTLSPDSAVTSGSDSVQTGVVAYRSSVLSTLLVQSGVAMLVTGALAVALGWVAARRALRPVQDVTSAARRLSADTLGARRLAMTGPRDELTELADTFDEMLDRLGASFDSQRRFVANASHELRTPLAAQRTLVEVAMAAPHSGVPLRRLGERLLVLNDRSERLIEGLLILARGDRGLPTQAEVCLETVVREVLGQQQASAEAAGVELHSELRPCLVLGDQVLLERLVTNLVQNAVQHNVPVGGRVWVRMAGEPALEVVNTGLAVPPAEVPGLFEPFRRLAGDRTGSDRGVGLGLSIVASVVRAHGGTVTAAARDDGGLTVSVRLRCVVREGVGVVRDEVARDGAIRAGVARGGAGRD